MEKYSYEWPSAAQVALDFWQNSPSLKHILQITLKTYGIYGPLSHHQESRILGDEVQHLILASTHLAPISATYELLFWSYHSPNPIDLLSNLAKGILMYNIYFYL